MLQTTPAVRLPDDSFHILPADISPAKMLHLSAHAEQHVPVAGKMLRPGGVDDDVGIHIRQRPERHPCPERAPDERVDGAGAARSLPTTTGSSALMSLKALSSRRLFRRTRSLYSFFSCFMIARILITP